VQIYRYAENAAQLKAAGELAGAGGFDGVGGRRAWVLWIGSGCGGHGIRMCTKQILAEVRRLWVRRGGWFWRLRARLN
jgi:hypothetical protein